MNFHIPAGSTPIDPNESEGLIPPITTQQQLNEFEEINILEAWQWARTSRVIKSSLLSVEALKMLHHRMFDKTWKWAGRFRRTQKNIGAEAWQIETLLYDLLEDVKVWVTHQSYPGLEIVARFHHRLVSIHAFVNGNGRHGRVAADLLALQIGLERPTWGRSSMDGPTAREEYLSSLHSADRGEYAALIAFLSL